MQTSFNWSAIISALFMVGSALSIMIGHPALGAVFNDPNVAAEATAAVSGAAGLVSAFSSAVHVAVIHTPSTSASVPVVK